MLNYQEELNKIESQFLLRKRMQVTQREDSIISCNNKKLISFCSNDYLNLSQHPDIINAFKLAVDQYGVGSTSSQMICGYNSLQHKLETELAKFFGKPRALVFSTGYMTNLGLLTTLISKNDIILADKLCHASLIDGMRYSGTRFIRYKHNDMKHLNMLLEKYKSQSKWIVTGGVCSMGDGVAPLLEIIKLKNKYHAKLILDDAHGVGVLGLLGKGIIELFGVDVEGVDLLVGTFGKAFGGFGAFVVGNDELIEYLLQKCRTLIYTTALPPAIIQAMLASLTVVKKEVWRREKLQELIDHFRRKAKQLDLSLLNLNTPIQSIIIGCNEKLLQINQKLLDVGFWVGAIRPPTVPLNTARLRISLNVSHTIDQIDNLLEKINEFS